MEKPQDELKIGEEVTVKLTAVDFENKRVSLSIRALLEDEDNAADEAAEDTADEAADEE